MFIQAMASVFASSGVLRPQRYAAPASNFEEKVTNSGFFDQDSSSVELSEEGKQLANVEEERQYQGENDKEQSSDTDTSSQNLTEEEKREVEKLKKRDEEVRQHEQAHVAAAGSYARGGPQFEYTRGPDDKEYAIGGHVNIDSGPIPGDPEATIQKARVVKRAALAPGSPSGEDRNVAAQAARMENEARMELSKQQRAGGSEEASGSQETGGESSVLAMAREPENNNGLSTIIEKGQGNPQVINYGNTANSMKLQGGMLNVMA
ncbi:MAG: hypothetical protein HQK83_17305 [Fibrobacteria bacterium]|nr:hypothetical protein [Fibrobacteria bacterium]